MIPLPRHGLAAMRQLVALLGAGFATGISQDLQIVFQKRRAIA